MADKKKRDPLFGAAVLKLTFQRRKEEQSPQFKAIYDGVLRDLSVTDADVDAYLAEHLADVEAALGAKGPPPAVSPSPKKGRA